MIGKLKGIIDLIDLDNLILDVNGVGYIIYCTSKTLAKLPSPGQMASLLTYMQVKEDDISLYGFLEREEKEWFENLITVQGIGPRLALVILSYLSYEQLINAIATRDKVIFKNVSGVGTKLAERIFTELGRKAEQNYVGHPSNAEVLNEDLNVIKDALIALTNLGYNKMQVSTVCKKLYNENPTITINDLIKLALRELASQ